MQLKEYQRLKLEPFTHDTNSFADWYDKLMNTWYVSKPGSDKWINFFVSNIDYLANPAQDIKNASILMELAAN